MEKLKHSTPVWVIGHKNPDTDSICAAIAYANLKNQTEEGDFVPKKAGPINDETRYVLKTFHVREPETVSSVGTQIRDMNYRHTEGVDAHLSLKKAWALMRQLDVVTLPIVKSDGRLDGLIVNGDIAYSYMDVYDNRELGRARTQYKNIIETLNGVLICGNEHAYFNHGKVVVAAGNTKSIRSEVDGDDLVILGNVVEHQKAVLEEIPGCMIVTGVKEVDPEVVKTAEAIDCVLIATEYDTFTTARLINQSIPIRYFMTKSDIVSFEEDDYLDDVNRVIGKVRHRDFPILDEHQRYVGMFSRRNLLNPEKKRVILVDHNEKNQAVDGINEAEILEVIDHHKIGSLETISPIYFRNMPLGCCSTIIYQMYQERKVKVNPQMAGLMLSAILSDTLMFKSPTCTGADRVAAEELAKIAGVNIEKHAMAMFEAGSNFSRKSISEIFYTDFKTFSQGDTDFGVSQISAVSDKQLNSVRKSLGDFLERVLADRNLNQVYVMLTNILDQSTRLVCAGGNSGDIVRAAFPDKPVLEDENGSFQMLPGVVSRKKQVIPALIDAMEQE
ncbi:MAG: putative manganese-dependent inorganic diphosphatase [Lachnospiraceae bacterium]|uniref:inorganic diphosphatase n=1 Tax=Candidatus Weimeria bifida TaxID=2599074 RepID=A0A6N7IWT9_9FIRM|nr:putative manganese-dependent inorganic diphosphatase [Candidatus Weimeria bifida]RRF96266.1 MAG: putative manganese-dependent inorganic diphosphatase [Lachnospiraceae bacterium]